MTTLVIGGAGYIGSHMIKRLREEGEPAIVLDNLSTGFADSVLEDELISGNFASEAITAEIFGKYQIDAVMHFASCIEVGESVSAPAKYYCNNVANTLALLDLMVRHDIKVLVFSSSAAVYGHANSGPLTEAAPCAPLSPYGRTKRIVEQALEDFRAAYGLRFFALRYFNAAGADPKGRIGERHNPETHLIPLVLQAASGRRDSITVFGRDYPTPDGTCLRDYVHVDDLCEAHLLALRALRKGHEGGILNLGNARAHSVAEVVDAARRITGRPIPVKEGPRRPGDPAVLVADASAAFREFGWSPKTPDLETIIEHAWLWERQKGVRW